MRENFKTIFRSLRYRNYRLFFAGQLISLVGTWMQSLALSWLVYRLTNSTLMLGWVIFSSQIFSFVLTPFAGVLIDRWNRHRIIVIAQFLAMIQALVLAALVLYGVIAIWHIIVLSILLGVVGAFEIPARHSFVIDMVEDKSDLGNAIALNSFIFNAARLIGPTIAGMLIALVGEGICFLINGVSYIAVIVALLAMKLPAVRATAAGGRMFHDLKVGVLYALNHKPIRTILLLVSLLSLMGMSYGVLMPVFAKDILHGDSRTLGFLMASIGVGALAGTLYLASSTHPHKLATYIWVASLVFGLGLAAFSFSHSLLFSMLLLFIAGAGMMVQMASCNTMLQTLTDDDKRGRVMSFYTMAFMGMTTFGSLLTGWLASKIGASITLIIGGAFCALGAVLFATQVPLFSNAVASLPLRVAVLPGEATPEPDKEDK